MVNCRDIPALAAQVQRKTFRITDEDDGGRLMSKSNWNDLISPGKKLSMAMIFEIYGTEWQDNAKRCPTCRFVHKGSVDRRDLERVRWYGCPVVFISR